MGDIADGFSVVSSNLAITGPVTVGLPPGGVMVVAAVWPAGAETCTPGSRYECDADGVLWHTPIGMQGEALGPRTCAGSGR